MMGVAFGGEPNVGAFPEASVTLPDAGSDGAALPELKEGASLHEYLTYAALNNPGLRAAHGRWRAAMERIPQVTSLADPKFTYTYYVQHVETRVGPQRQSFSLAQMFPWFGKLRLRGDMAAKGAEAAWQELQAQRLQLLYRVSVLYHDYAYLREATQITQENFELLKALEAVARQRYRTGQALTAVVQAQVELGKLEDRLRSLHGLRPALSTKLSTTLDRKSRELLPWPAPSAKDMPVLDAETVRADVWNRNPELARLSAMVEQQGLAVELARKDGYPDVTLGLTVVETGPAAMSGVSESGKDPIMAMVAINVPIWRDKYRAEQREAMLRRGAFADQREEKRNGLEADAALALYYYEDAARKSSLYGDTLLPKAEQSLGVAQQAFEGGKAEFLTVVDAQRVLLEFRLALAKARADQGKRYAELQMLTGASALPVLSNE
jgi:outer membrane protein TolC